MKIWENRPSSLRNAARPLKPIYEVIGIASEVQKIWSRKKSSIFEGPRSFYIGKIGTLSIFFIFLFEEYHQKDKFRINIWEHFFIGNRSLLGKWYLQFSKKSTARSRPIHLSMYLPNLVSRHQRSWENYRLGMKMISALRKIRRSWKNPDFWHGGIFKENRW